MVPEVQECNLVNQAELDLDVIAQLPWNLFLPRSANSKSNEKIAQW